ncbi:MAG: iron-containing alcohol dehydrogenase [Nitrospirota bacterium]|nr:iron-containing alcohol dehydrogenase [Nitrospirota bacterium]
MDNFEFHLPTRIIFGNGSFSKFAAETARVAQKVILVTGRGSVRQLGLLDKALQLLERAKVEVVIFDRIEPNPRAHTIDEGAAIAGAEKCGAVVALGGGSAMDAAKGIALVAASGGSVWDYVRKGPGIMRPLSSALPIITVPTIAATGSEANSGAVITNEATKEKGVIFGKPLYPVTAVIDPALTASLPPNLTADGGVDILCHLLESYFTGNNESPIQDRITESIARVVIEETPKAVRNGGDLSARANLSWASTLALSGIPESGRMGSFPLHGIEHSLSGHYDISHGRGLAILLPVLMDYTCAKRPERYTQLGERVFGLDLSGATPEEGARQSIAVMRQWLEGLGIELTLRSLGINEERFEQMANDALRLYGRGKDFLENPRPLYKDDIIAIFRAAL